MKPSYEKLEQELKDLEAQDHALTERMQYLENIIDNSVDIYWQTDLQGNPVFLSKAHSDFYGYSMEESYAMNIRYLFKRDQREKGYKIWDEVLKRRHINPCSKMWLKKRMDRTFPLKSRSGLYGKITKSSAYAVLPGILPNVNGLKKS